jgi:Asp-tRNA(Asn)/Glu-tRNA(Gln) amidotransferase C subunit
VEKEVEGFVPGLTDDLITELLRRLCQLRNKEYTENEKREFGGHIGAIAGLFEKVTEAETKKEASEAEAMT